MHTYGIAITTYGNHDLVQKCIESLEATEHPIIIIDTKAMGWPLAKAWNFAVKHLCIDQALDAVLITNDDVLFEPGTTDTLVDCLLRRQYEEKLPRDLDCLVVKAWDKKGRQYAHVDELKWQWRDFFNEGWFTFCTSRRLFDLVGEFDETWDAYFEDADMSYRIYKAGYGAISYPSVWHEGSLTTKNNPELEARIRWQKPLIAEYFNEKHGEYAGQGPIFRRICGED